MVLTVGTILEGKVKSITNFGAFVALPENKTGMVHISEVANAYVSDIRQHLTEGQDVKVVVICAIVLCMATLLTLRFISEDLNAQTQELRSQAAELERENEELQEKIDALGSVESDERIAQEELGLAYPDTVIIQPEQ